MRESRHAVAVLGSCRFRRLKPHARGNACHNPGSWRIDPRQSLAMTPHDKEKSRRELRRLKAWFQEILTVPDALIEDQAKLYAGRPRS